MSCCFSVPYAIRCLIMLYRMISFHAISSHFSLYCATLDCMIVYLTMFFLLYVYVHILRFHLQYIVLQYTSSYSFIRWHISSSSLLFAVYDVFYSFVVLCPMALGHIMLYIILHNMLEVHTYKYMYSFVLYIKVYHMVSYCVLFPFTTRNCS